MNLPLYKKVINSAEITYRFVKIACYCIAIEKVQKHFLSEGLKQNVKLMSQIRLYCFSYQLKFKFLLNHLQSIASNPKSKILLC